MFKRPESSGRGPTPEGRGPKLRPATDIFDKINWDDALDKTDYEVAYKDRFTGRNLTKPVVDWNLETTAEDFVSEKRIMFFYRKSDRRVVWHRDKKIDLLKGSGHQSPVPMVGLDGVDLEIDVRFELLEGKTAEAAMNHLLFYVEDGQWEEMVVHFDADDSGEDPEEKKLAYWRFINSANDFKALTRGDLRATKASHVHLSDEAIDSRPDTIAYRRVRFVRTSDGKLVWRRSNQTSGSKDRSPCPLAPPSAVLQYFRVFQMLANSDGSMFPMDNYLVTSVCPESSETKQTALVLWESLAKEYMEKGIDPMAASWHSVTRKNDGKIIWTRDGVDLVFGSGRSAAACSP